MRYCEHCGNKIAGEALRHSAFFENDLLFCHFNLRQEKPEDKNSKLMFEGVVWRFKGSESAPLDIRASYSEIVIRRMIENIYPGIIYRQSAQFETGISRLEKL